MDRTRKATREGNEITLQHVSSKEALLIEELVAKLLKDPSVDEDKVRSLLRQVEARDYNPPKRERILEWMRRQDFPICAAPDDPNQCNVYRNLEFPKEVYDKISQFYERAER